MDPGERSRDEQGGSDPGRRHRWVDGGAAGDFLEAEQDPRDLEILDAVGVPARVRRQVVRRNVPFTPYYGLVLPATSIPLGVFLLHQIGLPWGLLGALFSWLFAVFGVVVFVMRVGAWHRYRREARELLRGTGRKLPVLLRWYS